MIVALFYFVLSQVVKNNVFIQITPFNGLSVTLNLRVQQMLSKA